MLENSIWCLITVLEREQIRNNNNNIFDEFDSQPPLSLSNRVKIWNEERKEYSNGNSFDEISLKLIDDSFYLNLDCKNAFRWSKLN
jgi:hypothetical protein